MPDPGGDEPLPVLDQVGVTQVPLVVVADATQGGVDGFLHGTRLVGRRRHVLE